MASRISNASSSSSSSSAGAYRNRSFVRNRDGFESDRAEKEYNVSGSLHQKSYHHQQKQKQQNRQRKEVWYPEKSQGNWRTTVKFDNSNRATASGNPQPSSANIVHGNATLDQGSSHFRNGNRSFAHGNTDFDHGNANFGQQNANFGHRSAILAQQSAIYARGGSRYGQQSSNYADGNSSYGQGSANYDYRSASYNQGSASYRQGTAIYAHRDSDYAHETTNYVHGSGNFAQGDSNYLQNNVRYAHKNANPPKGSANYVPENADSHYSNDLSRGIRFSPSNVSYDGIRGESGSNYISAMNRGNFGSNNAPVVSQGEFGSRGATRLNHTHAVNQDVSWSRRKSRENTSFVNQADSRSQTTSVLNQVESGSSRTHAMSQIASGSNDTRVMNRGESRSNNSWGESGANTPYVVNTAKERGSDSSGLPSTTRHDNESCTEFPPLPTANSESRSRDALTSATVSQEPSNKSVWGSLFKPITSWYDECEDVRDISPLETRVAHDFTTKDVEASYAEDHESLSSFVKGAFKGNDDHDVYKNAQLQNDAPRRDTWRKNTRYKESSVTPWRQNMQHTSHIPPLVETSLKSPNKNSWRQKDLKTNKEDVNRTMESHGAFKHIESMRSGQEERQIPQRMEEMQKNNWSVDTKESITIQNSSTQVNTFAEAGSDEAMLPFINGTCEDMCPVREREQRERLRDLSVFERANRNPSKTTKDLAVKKFCRTFSSANFQASDVRPLPTLKRTLQYLLRLLDDSEFSFDVVHDFLFDRTRAIRQELDMQRIINTQAINMYEQIVRFHILSEHELHQRHSAGQVSNSHLNLQQLSKSLLSLFNLYNANSHERHENEPEFRAYYVLLNLGSNNHYRADSLSLWFRDCTPVLINTKEVKFARAVLRCYLVGNFWKFFQLVQEATFLQSCLMEVHFNEVRLKSLEAMNHGGYKLHPIPLADISKGLLIKEGDLEELCKLCGLSTGMDTSRVRCLFVKQSQFSVPSEIPLYRCPCVLNKQPSSYYETVVA